MNAIEEIEALAAEWIKRAADISAKLRRPFAPMMLASDGLRIAANELRDLAVRLREREGADRRDLPPANCRERLRREGKPYPRSGCWSCGDWGRDRDRCNAALDAAIREKGAQNDDRQ